MSSVASEFVTGFSDFGADSHAVFRSVLTAMSRPGRIVRCPAGCDAPPSLFPWTAAIALTLLNQETAVWLDRHLYTASVRRFLAFHTSAPLESESRRADYVLIGDPVSMPRFDEFRQGSSLRPDRSATLLVQLRSLRAGPPETLRGPGIEASVVLRPLGLPDWFWPAWDANRDGFPRGLDLLMTDGRDLIALPRTVGRR